MNSGQINEVTQQHGSQPKVPAAERFLAYAALYDLLSEGFAYPGADFYAALQNKVFETKLSAAVAVLGDIESLRIPHSALQAAIEVTRADCPLPQLESDYIALFDASRDQPAVHPYGRLYGEQIMNPSNLLQKLQSIYGEHGLMLDADKGAEQADHITVQLEFMALLFQHLAQAPDDPESFADAKSFQEQLSWLPRFVAKLDERDSPHCFYHPLAHFMSALYASSLSDQSFR